MKAIWIVAALILTGCATQKALVATGGSRADGTVDLAYQYNWLESPVVDYQGGLEIARQRCRAWGYESADAFGGQKQECQQRNAYGNCLAATVTVTYQCKGGGPH